MAVQKNKKTRSRRNMRRSHDALTVSQTRVDPLSGERHLSHHVTPAGYYKGKLVIPKKDSNEDEGE